MFEKIANATVKIESVEKGGSGFHFLNRQIILTNYHVVAPPLKNKSDIFAVTEKGDRFKLELVSFSDKKNYDFAVFKALDDFPKDRVVLKPKAQNSVKRGTQVCFSGFPNGINDLLIHGGYVSGKFGDIGFYIAGSVNAGNSGGPIIDMKDQSVIGIVTQRRFLGSEQLEETNKKAKELYQRCKQFYCKGSVIITGVDFADFAELMAQSLLLTSDVIETNANTGIGIGFHIKYAAEHCKQLGIV